jgi:carbon-monoxide dehydrogenase large subunit
MAQIIADQLGVDVKDVVILHGDTDSAPFGGGTGGSRSGTIGGGAAITAGREMREKLVKIAAHLLEAAEADIELEDGKAFVAGVPSRSYTVRELAQIAYTDVRRLPEGMAPGLEVVARYQPKRPMTFSNGTHIAVVEVDVRTGLIRTIDYAVANDCGKLINPMIVEGQIHGGVAQGIGSVLLEALRYDEDAQLTTTSLVDYMLPVTTDVPNMKIRHLETPSDSEGGFKGMGEGSLIAAPAAVANAISDALEPFGVFVNELPVTPEQVLAWVGKGAVAAG